MARSMNRPFPVRLASYTAAMVVSAPYIPLEAVYIGYTREESGGHWTRKSTDYETRKKQIRAKFGKNAEHLIKNYYEPALKDNAEYEAWRGRR